MGEQIRSKVTSENVEVVVDCQGDGGDGGQPPGRGRRWLTARERVVLVVDCQGDGGDGV